MQLALNLVVAAAPIILLGAGFSLIYSTSRFFHFAHGAVFLAAPYLTVAALKLSGAPLAAAMALGVAGAAAVGALIEITAYAPLRRRGATPVTLLLVSLGLYVVIQNAVSLIFGDRTLSFRPPQVPLGMEVLGGRVTTPQIILVAASVSLVVALIIMLEWTSLGRAARALAQDFQLAGACGLDVDGVYLTVVTIGSFLAGTAGVLVAWDADLTPGMALSPLMMAVVATVVGGVGRIPGVVGAAILVAGVQQASGWWLGARWGDVVTLGLLFVVLLVRPTGLVATAKSLEG